MASTALLTLIDDELRWREKELAILKLRLISDVGEEERFRCSYRSLVAITYAHYEAFIKLIASQILIDIRAQSIKPSDCTPMLQRSLLAKAWRRDIERSSSEQLIGRLLDGTTYVNSLGFPSEQLFFEISNLNITNLEALLSSVGISPSLIVDYKSAVGRIVDLRHRCAHGERLSFDSSKTTRDLAGEIFAVQARILELMHAVAVEAIDHCAERKFLRPNEAAAS